MSTRSLRRWQHDHSFGQEGGREGERRTLAVVLLTLATMAVEVACGLAFGSMALLADGVHMASHALALGISFLAYVYARRHARDDRFSFGTGKVGSLAGFSSALLLGVIAAGMLWESARRLFEPSEIAFDQAILVAALGLAVNAASAIILAGGGHGHHHGHHHHGHDHHGHHHHGHDHHGHHHHGHDHHGHDRPGRHRDGHRGPPPGGQDHNLRAAYLHVLADALTSVLALAALLGGKYLDAGWLDPAMGILGAVLVANWARGLALDAGRVLLDWQAPAEVRDDIRRAVERGGDRLADLHVWTIGPGAYAAILSVVSDDPRPPEHYRDLVPAALGVRHLSVEVHRWS